MSNLPEPQTARDNKGRNIFFIVVAIWLGVAAYVFYTQEPSEPTETPELVN